MDFKPPPATALNGLLSSLCVGDPAISRGLSQLQHAAPRPVNGVGCGLAFRGAFAASEAACAFLEHPSESTQRVCAEIRDLYLAAQAKVGIDLVAEQADLRGRSLRKLKAWRLLLHLAAPGTSPVVLILGGLLLLSAIQKKRPIPGAQVDNLLRHAPTCDLYLPDLRLLLESDVPCEDTQWPWLHTIKKRWPEIRNLLEALPSAPPPPSFNDRARGQLLARAVYPSPARRAGVTTHRVLSRGQFKQVSRAVANWIDLDDWRGGYGVLAAISGLTVELVAEIPLLKTEVTNWAIVLDLDCGSIKFNLEFLSPHAAAAPATATAEMASLILVVPLPQILCERLRARRNVKPDATCLHDLYPEAPQEVAGHQAMVEGSEIVASWSRWGNSAGVYLRQAGMDDLLAAAVTGDFGHVPKAKLHYAVLSPLEITQAAAALHLLTGWGEPVALAPIALGFGCRVVPTDQVLKEFIAYRRALVEQHRSSKAERRLDVLFDFHNQYARLIAAELAMLMALRKSEHYEILADVYEDFDLWASVHDKNVPGPPGGLPVVLCHRAKASIRAYRRHCHALLERQIVRCSSSEEILAWLKAVTEAQPVPLLHELSTKRSLRPLGSLEAFGGCPADVALVGDVGRKWLENGLRRAGSPTPDVDLMLRHEVIGQTRYSSTSDFILAEAMARVGAAVDRLARPILGEALPGFSRSGR